MKIRYRLAAIASTVALAGAGALAGQGVASANTTSPFYNTGNGACITTDGTGNPVGLSGSGCANFGSENGEITNGHDYVEYYHNGTNGCLTDSGANVYIQTCTPGDSRQMWWYDKQPTGWGEVINLYATLHYGHDDCMTENTGSGDAVTVTACSGGLDYYQLWTHS